MSCSKLTVIQLNLQSTLLVIASWTYSVIIIVPLVFINLVVRFDLMTLKNNKNLIQEKLLKIPNIPRSYGPPLKTALNAELEEHGILPQVNLQHLITIKGNFYFNKNLSQPPVPRVPPGGRRY